MRTILPVSIASTLCLVLAAGAPARPQTKPADEAKPADAAKPKDDAKPEAAGKLDKDHVARQAAVGIGGVEVAYRSVAGTLPLRSEEGKEKARMFFVGYFREPAEDPSKRPITFVFNGGPGSSSVWLHLGAFGPKIVDLDAEGNARATPGKLVANAQSLLDISDLVFIDPPTTGYSRAATGENASQFHGLDEDVEAVGEFIRMFTTHFRRWASPKFLAGESYGTTRAAALSRHLQDRFGMYLNGVVLISAILDFRTAETDAGNDLAFLLMYPTCAATAQYHGRVTLDPGVDLKKMLQGVEERALAAWNVALSKGDALPDGERDAIAKDMAKYLGLSPEYLERCNLRVSLGRFQAELLREQRRSVGRLDSRFKGIDRDAAGDSADYDASYANILGPFAAGLNDYVRRDLGYESDLPYEMLTGRVQPWNWGTARNRYVNVATRLREALTKNPQLHVFLGSGLYDFATPYLAAEYTLDHLGLDPEQRARLHRARYEAGHMMYIHEPSRAQLKRDLAAFYAAALKGP